MVQLCLLAVIFSYTLPISTASSSSCCQETGGACYLLQVTDKKKKKRKREETQRYCVEMGMEMGMERGEQDLPQIPEKQLCHENINTSG